MRAGRWIDRDPDTRCDDLAPRADRQLDRTWFQQATRKRRCRGISGPGDHGNIGADTPACRRRFGDQPADLTRFANRRQHIEPQVEGVEDIYRPVITRHVIEQGRRRIARVGGGLTRKPESKPVFGLQRPARLAVHARLVIANPEQGRTGHAGADRVGQLALEDGTELPIGIELFAGSRVGPQDGGSQGFAVVKAERDPVHLSRKTHGRDIHSPIGDGLVDRDRRRFPPIRRVRLSPARMRIMNRIGRCAGADDRAVEIEEERLRGTGT